MIKLRSLILVFVFSGFFTVRMQAAHEITTAKLFAFEKKAKELLDIIKSEELFVDVDHEFITFLTFLLTDGYWQRHEAFQRKLIKFIQGNLLQLSILLVDGRNGQGRTPLVLASRKRGAERLFSYLLRNRIQNFSLVEILQEQDSEGNNILHLAVEAGLEANVFAIIESAGEMNVFLLHPQNNFGQTPLMAAVTTGSYSLVELLLNHGAAQTLDFMDVEGQTALSLAKIHNQTSILGLLQQHVAAAHGHTDVTISESEEDDDEVGTPTQNMQPQTFAENSPQRSGILRPSPLRLTRDLSGLVLGGALFWIYSENGYNLKKR